MNKKTDPYALFLVVSVLVLIVGGVMTRMQYKAMSASQRRLDEAKRMWDRALFLEKDIAQYPVRQDMQSTSDMNDVLAAIQAGDNKELLDKFQLKKGLAANYNLNVNPKQMTTTQVAQGMQCVTLPLQIDDCTIERLGTFLAAVQMTFPQVKTRQISWTQMPDKAEGTASVQLALFQETNQ